MNGNIKNYIYIIGALCMVFLLGKIFLYIFPWILVIGLITYMIMKIIGFVKMKKQQKNQSNFHFNNRSNNVYTDKASTDDYTNGEIIDVDYEEVDKK